MRSRKEVNERIRVLGEHVKAALSRLPGGESDPDVIEAIWQAEGLGTLLWALGLVELEPFDRTFDAEWLLATPTAHGSLRAKAELEHALETARLWHWRARTELLRAGDSVELPAEWESFEQLIAVAAMRGYERGLLPSPIRGDFAAFDSGYRELSPSRLSEALAIAWERHRALEWLCGSSEPWVETPTPDLMHRLLVLLPALVLAAPAPAGAVAPAPPILYVAGVQCPAHRSCTGKPAYFDRIRSIPRIGHPSRAVSNGAFSDSQPAWSPDHRRIAFARESHNGLRWSLWVMNADGSGARALTRGNVLDGQPSWSPDGKRLVFRGLSPSRKTFDLYTIASGGTGLRRITSNAPDVNVLNPDWSPNGKLIVFQRFRANAGAGTGIYTIRPDGSTLRRLRIGGQDPAWSPDMTRIAFVLPDPRSGGQLEIYLMRPNGTGSTRLTSGPETVAPAWSPDATRLAVLRGAQIAVVGRNGRVIKQLTRPTHGLVFVDTPAW